MVQNKRIATPYDDLTYRIIGCAMAVHRQLGPSYRENTYQRDLCMYFAQVGLSFESEKYYEVFDTLESKKVIGYYIPDSVVDEKVIVEIKAHRWLDTSHLAQIIGYLAVSGLSVGLLINFGRRSLQYKRILPPANLLEHHINRQWLFIPDWLKTSQDTVK